MPPLNLTRHCLESVAREQPDAVGFRFLHNDGRVDEWTFAETWDAIENAARNLIASGLAPGDRVLINLPHSPGYAFAFFGANLAGLVPIPVSPSLMSAEVAFLAKDSGARGAVSTPGSPPFQQR